MNQAYGTTAFRKSAAFREPHPSLRGAAVEVGRSPLSRLRSALRPAPASLSAPPAECLAANKMMFGPRPGDVERIRQMGVGAFIEEQLAPESIADAECDARMAQENFTLLDAELSLLWPRLALPFEESVLGYLETLRATWIRNLYSKRQLFEVLVDHWHNHFNVYGLHDVAYLVWPHYDRVIRQHVLGNFREFLEAIGSAPAMLFYLDNSSNSAAGPNENYARELFELHGMGAEAYTPGTDPPEIGVIYPGYRDWDVRESARCFTGWSVDDYNRQDWTPASGEFLYRPEWHDRFGKYLLNAWVYPDQGPLRDGRDVLDRIMAHPATARNVVTRLARRLISDSPSEAVISAGVAVFQANLAAPDQLKRVTRALLGHPDFLGSWAQKIKRPRESLAHALRSTQTTWQWTDTFWWVTYLTGQAPFDWPAPNGYPDRRGAWNSSSAFVYRWTVLNYLCEGWLDGCAVDLLGQTPSDLATAHQIVDFWAERILGYLPTSVELDPLYRFLAPGSGFDEPLQPSLWQPRIGGLVALILSSPMAQVR